MNSIKFAIGVILVTLLAPLAIGILPIWWLLAKILGTFHPDRDFFPIRRIWKTSHDWVNEKFCLNLEEIVGAAAIVLLVSYVLGGLNKLFSRK